MPQINVGTTAVVVVPRVEGYLLDFLVQNVSANNVYLVESTSESTATGIKIVPSDFLNGEDWDKDIILIADGDSSDVRYIYRRKEKKTG